MTDAADIVQRLREHADYFAVSSEDLARRLRTAATIIENGLDEITRLRAEVEALRAAEAKRHSDRLHDDPRYSRCDDGAGLGERGA